MKSSITRLVLDAILSELLSRNKSCTDPEGEGVDALVVHRPRANGELVRRAAGRGALAHRVHRACSADLLRQRRPRRHQRGGERQCDEFSGHDTTHY